MKIPNTDITFIESLIPQRAPFIMVSSLLEYSETHLKAGYSVNIENIFFKENRFLEPGIIEHMAQSVALHTGYQYHLKNQKAPTGYIGSINKIEIYELPKLNDELTTEVTILQEFLGVTLVDIRTLCNNRCIAQGQMKTVIAK